ncbi:RNA binding protein, putative [Trichophyton verrucosum HKI 0517]|uniref:Nucleolar protein 12 n=1 Tax=Trichophyton verrucosum (strain HKI 0517) TaxID=663202 RepID=D4D0I8_TRIVH|nr:RNA binding protein, putative [Trichophyton verrucosum HKI 0517]EFE44656.1 RNA binding protein, putative [Trichophyton verrucosum HKI 0517]
MGKKAKAQAAEAAQAVAAPVSTASTATGGFPLAATKVDPGLAALFAQSAGPVKEPELKPVSRREEKEADEEDEDEEDIEEIEEDEEDDDEEEEGEDDEDEEEDEDAEMEDMEGKASRKRKRGAENDDLEAAYLDRLSREEERERKKQAEKTKRVKTADEAEGDEGEADEEEEEEDKIPMHESLMKSDQADPMDKASRTLFLSNVSTEAIKSKSAKKTLLKHLSSLLPKPSSSSTTTPSTTHKIESLRFRSTAFSSTALPRRAAYAKKELMDSTTKGTNAYVVYSTAVAAKKALKLNGTIVLDRHIRVDSVSKPAPVDHTRCVFVGNLGFVDEEAQPADQDGEVKKKKKAAAAADVEEGLWRTFNDQCGGEGVVESVRVVRDRLTRVGKGFAYVQFKDENCVEAALLCDGKKFPPMLPRKLRVTRAKRIGAGSEGVREGASRQRPTGGKARKDEKLFGQAVAAELRNVEREKKKKKIGQRDGRSGRIGPGNDANAVPLGDRSGSGNADTRIVFEGYRAKDGAKPAFRMKGKKKGGKPKTRSSRRASAYKARK